MVARWSANPLGMLWLEMDAAFVTSGGNGGAPPAVARRSVVIAIGQTGAGDSSAAFLAQERRYMSKPKLLEVPWESFCCRAAVQTATQVAL